MKKYTNIANTMSRVEFSDHVQFLRRGQSVTSDLKVVKISKNILVEDLKVAAEPKPRATKTTETKAKSTKKPK